MDDKTMLNKIIEQNDTMMQFMVRQNQDIHELKNTVEGRFNRLESAVTENSIVIKENKAEFSSLKQSVDIAVTNHESRMRRLEEKVNI